MLTVQTLADAHLRT